MEQNNDSELLEPYKYLTEAPGKGIRPLLINGFNQWLKVEKKYLDEIAEIVQMLHNASLMFGFFFEFLQRRIDDIEDNSQLRRGNPVTHLIFGTPATINSANFVYFSALERCLKLGNPDAVSVFVGNKNPFIFKSR